MARVMQGAAAEGLKVGQCIDDPFATFEHRVALVIVARSVRW